MKHIKFFPVFLILVSSNILAGDFLESSAFKSSTEDLMQMECSAYVKNMESHRAGPNSDKAYPDHIASILGIVTLELVAGDYSQEEKINTLKELRKMLTLAEDECKKEGSTTLGKAFNAARKTYKKSKK